MKDGILGWLTWLVSLIVSIGIGGLFVAGTFTTVFLLKILPLVAHQTIGWFIIIIALWGGVMLLMKEFK